MYATTKLDQLASRGLRSSSVASNAQIPPDFQRISPHLPPTAAVGRCWRCPIAYLYRNRSPIVHVALPFHLLARSSFHLGVKNHPH